MKKALLLFLLTAAAGSLFAAGVSETRTDVPVYRETAADNPAVRVDAVIRIVNFDRSLGRVTVGIVPEDDGKETGAARATTPAERGYAFYRLSDGTNAEVRNADGVLVHDSLGQSLGQRMERYGAGASVGLRVSGDDFAGVSEARLFEGEGLALTPDEAGLLAFDSDRLRVSFPLDGGNRVLDLVFLQADGRFRRIRAVFSSEFFGGESALFLAVDPSRAHTYRELCLSLLGKLLDERFRTAVKTILGFDVDWTIFDDASGLDAALAGLRSGLASHFSARRDPDNPDEPWLQWTNEAFQALYGTVPNYYIEAYLAYLYSLDTPLYSFLYRNDEAGEAEHSFRTLTEEEGASMADAALRYLTGGVEYTPANEGAAGLASTDREVYAANRSRIAEWVAGDGTREAANDYAPWAWNPLPSLPDDGRGDAVAPYRVQVLETETRSGSVALVADTRGAAFRLARVDFWTSRNLAWDAGVVENAFALSGDVAAARPERLCDRDAAQGASAPENITLTRSRSAAGSPNPISAGYDFRVPQRIAALGVIRGAAPPAAAGLVANQVSITLRVRRNGNVVEETLREVDFVEYCSNTDNDELIPYGSRLTDRTINHRYAGYGLTAPGDATASYHYFVFNAPRDNVVSIRLVDSSPTDSLCISELMVFPENPVQYAGINPSLNSLGRLGLLHPEWTSANPELVGAFRAGDFRSACELVPAGEGRRVLELRFAREFALRQVVLWEANPDPGAASALFERPAALVAGIFLESRDAAFLLTPSDLGLKDGVFQGRLATPFLDAAGRSIAGNAIPYAPLGVDSPRSFAWKMTEQLRAQDWLAAREGYGPWAAERFDTAAGNAGTTRAVDAEGVENYRSGYASEADVLRAAGAVGLTVNPNLDYEGYPSTAAPRYDDGTTVRPFLPGLVAPNESGYRAGPSSPYTPDRAAGVDDVGLLLGALAMAGLGEDFVTTRHEYPALEADRYHGMASGNAEGLDAVGRPFFYTRSGDSILGGRYRVTRADLECRTVLVPDLSLLRVGDLLVRYDQYGAVHLGVVVALGWGADEAPPYGAPARDWWERIYVVSVRRGFQAVTLGTWGNPVGFFGGFASTPEDYQIRRVTVLDAGADENAAALNLVEPIQSLALEIEYARPDGREWPWIPNTGEFLVIDRLRVLASTEKEGMEGNYTADIPESMNNFVFETPIDAYATLEAAADGDNIRNNAGAGIEIYAYRGESGSRFLAAFLREPSGAYRAVYNPDYFRTGDDPATADRVERAGEALPGSRLSLSGDSLVFSHTRAAAVPGDADVSTDRFALRVVGRDGGGRFGMADTLFASRYLGVADRRGATVATTRVAGREAAFTVGGARERPGDDFQLRLAMQSRRDMMAKADVADVCAVFDHAMLWRANLYIDDGYDDWNALHPWPGTTDFPNEWNYSYAGAGNANRRTPIRLSASSEVVETAYSTLTNALVRGDGGQVIRLLPFTYIPEIAPQSDCNVVAYSISCNDSPFEFNDEMLQQLQLTSARFTAAYQPVTRQNVGLPRWSLTTAPGPTPNGENYGNYVFPSELMNAQGLSFGLNDGTHGHGLSSLHIDDSVDGQAMGRYGTSNPFAFLPGYSLHFWFTNGTNTANRAPYTNWADAISAGVDCVGLVQRTASYSGNRIVWEDIGGHEINSATTWVNSARKHIWSRRDGGMYCWLIAEKPGYGDPQNLELVRPGDVLEIWQSGAEPGHVAIVQDVVDVAPFGEITPAEVRLVEATWDLGRAWAKVTSDQNTLSFYNNERLSYATNWEILRLQTNQ